jgi:mRNA interferase RelE/StbE
VESYRVVLKRSAAKEIDSLDRKTTRQHIVKKIEELGSNPRPPGCEKLTGKHDRYRLRQGPFRILYEIKDDELIVFVVKVARRREVHRRTT